MRKKARNEVVQELYAAAMGTGSWPAALARLAEYTGTRFVSLDSYCMKGSVGRVHACNIPPDHPALVQYVAENGTGHELIERAFPHQTQGAVVRGSDLVPDREFFGTNIYNDFFRPLRMKYVVGLTLELTPDSITEFSLIKPHDAPDFSERDLSQLRDLQPDLTQIWHGYRHLASVQERLDTLQSLWDCFEHAVIVTDNERRIRFANRAAERLFKAGSVLASCAGRLQGAVSFIEARLQQAFECLADEQRQIISLTRPSVRPPDRLTATLFRLETNRVAMVLTDPSVAGSDLRPTLRQCYQMTAAEADLVNAILQGSSLLDYSEKNAVTYETTRTHLKSAMKKNGWRRQGQMIAALLQTLAPQYLFE